MNRLGLLQPAELSPAQKEAYDVMHEYTTSRFGDKFTYIDDQDRLLGPFGIQLHQPAVAKQFLAFATALRGITGLSPEVREVAILGVGHRTQAAYEEYAHRWISGFSQEELDLLHSGQCPEHFSPAQKIAYDIALALGKPGAMKQDLWNSAVENLGKDGATALIHYVGWYTYVSTILNGFDAQVPA